MTRDDIERELNNAEFSIEISCHREPDFIKISSGKVYRPERTARKRLMPSCVGGHSIFMCDECGHEVLGTDIYCSLCGSRFV